MSVSQLIPWNRNRGASSQSLARDVRDPFVSLHQEMNRLFDELWRQTDALLPREGDGLQSMQSTGWPNVELVEQDRQIVVSAELPGLQEKDVEVLVENGQLVLRGERRGEHEDKNRRISERWYGRFERRVPLQVEVQVDKARAQFRDGVLSVTLPKSENALTRSVRIPIDKAA